MEVKMMTKESSKPESKELPYFLIFVYFSGAVNACIMALMFYANKEAIHNVEVEVNAIVGLLSFMFIGTEVKCGLRNVLKALLQINISFNLPVIVVNSIALGLIGFTTSLYYSVATHLVISVGLTLLLWAVVIMSDKVKRTSAIKTR